MYRRPGSGLSLSVLGTYFKLSVVVIVDDVTVLVRSEPVVRVVHTDVLKSVLVT